MFERILIANRGEIALRVIRTCREMGIEAIAVYSDADSAAPHVAAADRAVRLGASPPAESYLSIDRVLAAARETSANAIHPGYGFLSENSAFAEACGAEGITFIGPSPAALAAIGSKVAARRLAQDAGVPVVPGEIPSGQGDDELTMAVRRLGLPVLIKPSAGGGGIGMRTVRQHDALPDAIGEARRAALGAFGDGTLYVERLIERPRHVEIQVAADDHGGVVHLFERECSIQRRHQKLVEESPSAAVSGRLRARMGEAAVALARQAGYRNVGTIEFLVEGAGDEASFYFLEMNTRLQVEHPVTEAVTGVDLVRAQIVVAAGEPLPWRQEQLTQRGHAIEARVYAEDPLRDDLPQAGRLLVFRPPVMPGIRVDAGVVEGDDVTVHYDPLLAKVISWGETREIARRRLSGALREFPILGIASNTGLLLEILEHPRFVAGEIDTALLDSQRREFLQSLESPAPPEVQAVARAARKGRRSGAPGIQRREDADPWSRLRGFRS